MRILDGSDETLTTNGSGQATVTVASTINPDDIAGMLATPAQNAVSIVAQRKPGGSTGREFLLTFYGSNGNTRNSVQVQFTWAVVGS